MKSAAPSSTVATNRCLPSLAPSQRTPKGVRVPGSASSRWTGTPLGTPCRGRRVESWTRNYGVEVSAIRDGAVLDRPLRVAVVGGGPAGACCAETLAKSGIETYLFERKLDNCKVRHSTVHTV